MAVRRGEPDRPLHIGLLAPAIPASGIANGIVTYTRIMRDALRAQGHQVSILTAFDYEDERGEPHKRAPEGLVRSGLASLRGRLDRARRSRRISPGPFIATLREVNARLPLDVLEMEESFGWSRDLMGRGPTIVTRLHGPHIYGKDDLETDEERATSEQRIVDEGRSLAVIRALTSPSARLLKATLDHYRVRPPIAETIPNPIPVAPPAERWSLGRADPDQLLCVGRFDTRKGADVVVEAFQRALRQRPGLRLVMVGPDPGLTQPDGGRVHFADHVRTLSPEARERIDYLGRRSAEEIAELRLRSAFTIIGSRFENFPYSLAESMAIGAPSIVSDSFGNGEMVIDGETGLVVPIGDSEAMAAGILRLRDNPGALAEMGDRAYRRCAEWLDPDRVARETVALYRRAGA
ncbi:glycosyltransferase family 4 protein [Sphingomonas sp.]|uniref:glycosyltransferase family 4 protein n=1 Tax=Sphingomonas sp. TaxID=28214 RepID=UPI000DB68AB4|nr:glycosyltransferase family 4 protein [Sphingomonas sp.]PZU09165.1 MAG: hypothetical protein DI605_10370 [Sphingomonas sp.]